MNARLREEMLFGQDPDGPEVEEPEVEESEPEEAEFEESEPEEAELEEPAPEEPPPSQPPWELYPRPIPEIAYDLYEWLCEQPAQVSHDSTIRLGPMGSKQTMETPSFMEELHRRCFEIDQHQRVWSYLLYQDLIYETHNSFMGYVTADTS